MAVKFKCLSKRHFHRIKLVSTACLCAAHREASQSAILHPFNTICLPPYARDIAPAACYLQCVFALGLPRSQACSVCDSVLLPHLATASGVCSSQLACLGRLQAEGPTVANNAEGDAQAAALEAAQDRPHSQDQRVEGRGEADVGWCMLSAHRWLDHRACITYHTPQLGWTALDYPQAAKATCWRHLLVAPRCSCSS